jgi:hypothetical protein
MLTIKFRKRSLFSIIYWSRLLRPLRMCLYKYSLSFPEEEYVEDGILKDE